MTKAYRISSERLLTRKHGGIIIGSDHSSSKKWEQDLQEITCLFFFSLDKDSVFILGRNLRSNRPPGSRS